MGWIFPQLQEADSLQLLAGQHTWPDAQLEVSLTLVGNEGAVLPGAYISPRGTAHFVCIGVSVVSGGIVVFDVGRVALVDCVYRQSVDMSFGNCDSVAVRGCTFLNNGGYRSAGALSISTGQVRIENCWFEGNRSLLGDPEDPSGGGGGAIALFSPDDVEIRGCVFKDNVAVSASAVYSYCQRLVFENNTLVGNECVTGALVVVSGGEALVRQNVFAGNAAFALWIDEGTSYATQLYCNAFWENNTINRDDFGERENRQWRAEYALGYDGEGESDFHSTLADPMFCDSLEVDKNSALARQLAPCSPIGGARGVGCIVEPTITTSWGDLKNRFIK